MRTVHSITLVALVGLVACSNNEQPHQRPVLTQHKPMLQHATQSDLARELDDADRRGTWGDVRYRWQGQELEWTVTRHRVLCRHEHECNVAAFPIAHGAQRGWMPGLTFAPGETSKTITILVYGDSKTESDETFFVNLSGASGNAIINSPQGMGTILDDDHHGKK